MTTNQEGTPGYIPSLFPPPKEINRITSPNTSIHQYSLPINHDKSLLQTHFLIINRYRTIILDQFVEIERYGHSKLLVMWTCH